MASLALVMSPPATPPRQPRRPHVIWPGGVEKPGLVTPVLLFDSTNSPGLHATPRKPTPFFHTFGTPPDHSPWVQVLGLSRTPETPLDSALDRSHDAASPARLLEDSWEAQGSWSALVKTRHSADPPFANKGSPCSETSLQASLFSDDAGDITADFTGDGKSYCSDVGCEVCQSSFFEDRTSTSHFEFSTASDDSTLPSSVSSPLSERISPSQPSPSPRKHLAPAFAFESTPLRPRFSSNSSAQQCPRLLSPSTALLSTSLTKPPTPTPSPLTREEFIARLAPSYFGPDAPPRDFFKADGKKMQNPFLVPGRLGGRVAPLTTTGRGDAGDTKQYSRAELGQLQQPIKRRTTSSLRPMRSYPTSASTSPIKATTSSEEGGIEAHEAEVDLEQGLDLDLVLYGSEYRYGSNEDNDHDHGHDRDENDDVDEDDENHAPVSSSSLSSPSKKLPSKKLVKTYTHRRPSPRPIFDNLITAKAAHNNANAVASANASAAPGPQGAPHPRLR